MPATSDRSKIVAHGGGGRLVAVLLLVAAFMTASVLGFGAWESGMGDAALIAYGGAALLLGLRWRVLGEAICIPLAAATAVVGLG